MKAAEVSLACAPATASAGVDIITSIVQSVVVAGAFCQRAFERLEPCAVKVARTVLRGGSGGNVASLPDFGCAIGVTRFSPLTVC